MKQASDSHIYYTVIDLKLLGMHTPLSRQAAKLVTAKLVTALWTADM